MEKEKGFQRFFFKTILHKEIALDQKQPGLLAPNFIFVYKCQLL